MHNFDSLLTHLMRRIKMSPLRCGWCSKPAWFRRFPHFITIDSGEYRHLFLPLYDYYFDQCSHFYLACHRRLTKPIPYWFNLNQGGTQAEFFFSRVVLFFNLKQTQVYVGSFDYRWSLKLQKVLMIRQLTYSLGAHGF